MCQPLHALFSRPLYFSLTPRNTSNGSKICNEPVLALTPAFTAANLWKACYWDIDESYILWLTPLPCSEVGFRTTNHFVSCLLVYFCLIYTYFAVKGTVKKCPNCSTYHTNVMLEETFHYKDLDMRHLTQLIRVELVMGVQCRFGPCGNSWLWRYLCLYHCLMSHALQAKNADAKRGSKKGREIMKQGNSRQKSPAILHLRWWLPASLLWESHLAKKHFYI